MDAAEKQKLLIETRSEYVSLVKKELLGPGSEISIPDAEHELITNSPDVRYSVGILFPRNNIINADNDDSARVEESATEEDVDELEGVDSENIQEEKNGSKNRFLNSADEENLDEEIGLAAQNMPSSMGITFFAFGEASVINCKVSFGTYKRAKAEDCRIPFLPRNPDEYSVPEVLGGYLVYDSVDHCLKFSCGGLKKKEVRALEEQDLLEFDEYNIFNLMYKLSDQLRGGYVRVPHLLDVRIEFGNADYVDNNKNLDGTKAKLTALRRKIKDGLYSITIMLVNDSEEKTNGTRCIFQPEIKVETSNNSFVFQEYSGMADFSTLDNEEKSLELQYRNKKVYGTGLGTSVNWVIDGNWIVV